jgi:hypothetical protein
MPLLFDYFTPNATALLFAAHFAATIINGHVRTLILLSRKHATH